MRFLLILTQLEEAWNEAPPGQAEHVYQQYLELEDELKAAGKFIQSMRLRPRGEAQTLRNLAAGKRSRVDGPFVDSQEAIGGLYILECESMDEAVQWAQRMPNYGHGSVEIRPFWD